MQFISDLSKEHIDFLEPSEGLFPSEQERTKPIYDEMQEFHPNTLLKTIPMAWGCDRALKRFEDLVDIVDRSGVDGAPLHLKIKAYHPDVASGVRQKTALKQPGITELLMPRGWYLKSIDPDGKRPFGEVKHLVVKRAHQQCECQCARAARLARHITLMQKACPC